MWAWIIGILIGIILTNIAQGVLTARTYYLFDGERYKDITERVSKCVHSPTREHEVAGVSFMGCRWCSSIFVKLTDLIRVRYE